MNTPSFVSFPTSSTSIGSTRNTLRHPCTTTTTNVGFRRGRRPPSRTRVPLRTLIRATTSSDEGVAVQRPEDGGVHDNNNNNNTTRRIITRKPSGTVVGRVLVEIMALIAGFTVLFVVAVWKLLNILAGYLRRLFGWVSNVRMLGHWAFVRVQALFLGVVTTIRYSYSGRGSFVASFAALFSRARDAARNIYNSINIRDVKSAGVPDDNNIINTQRIREEEEEKVPPSTTDTDIGAKNTNNNTSNRKRPRINIFRKARGPRLILLRHAKSLWDIAGPDHERSLSAAGEAEARSIARELEARGWRYDSVLCSNSRRTVQTLELMNTIDTDTNTSSNIKMTEALYFAVSADEMAEVVDAEAAPGECRLIVAHSPGIDELVESLTGTKPQMGTACAALLEYVGDSSGNNNNNNTKNNNSSYSAPLKDATRAWNLVDLVCPVPVEK